MMAGGGPAALHSPGPAPSCRRNKLSFFGIERGVDRALTPVPRARRRSLKEHLQGLLATHIGPRQSRRIERNYPTDIPNRSKLCQFYRAESVITFGSD